MLSWNHPNAFVLSPPRWVQLYKVHSTVIEREIVRAEKSEKFMPTDGLNALVS